MPMKWHNGIIGQMQRYAKGESCNMIHIFESVIDA